MYVLVCSCRRDETLQTTWFNQQEFIAYVSGGCKSGTKVTTVSVVSSEFSPLPRVNRQSSREVLRVFFHPQRCLRTNSLLF